MYGQKIHRSWLRSANYLVYHRDVVHSFVRRHSSLRSRRRLLPTNRRNLLLMSYLIQVVSKGETIATERTEEHPSEDRLRQLVAETKGEFADVSRL